MIGTSTTPSERVRLLFVAIFLVSLAAAYLENGVASEAGGSVVISAFQREPTTDERIHDLSFAIDKIETARSAIKQNTCEAKQKCDPLDYEASLKELKSAAGSLAWAKVGLIKYCMTLYEKSTKDCVAYSEDLHSALHMVEDLARAIERKDKTTGPITSDENNVILRYSGRLADHQQKMKDVLKCLKDDSEKDKARCESLRPPVY